MHYTEHMHLHVHLRRRHHEVLQHFAPGDPLVVIPQPIHAHSHIAIREHRPRPARAYDLPSRQSARDLRMNLCNRSRRHPRGGRHEHGHRCA